MDDQFKINNGVFIENLPLRAVDLAAGSGYVKFTFLGIPYTGQMKGNLDFHNTRFTPQTDLGDISVPVKFYIDHGLSPIPELRFKPLGVARIGEETPEGRLIDVFVEQRNQYLSLLLELKERDMLRGSAQAIASMYSVKRNGEIERFHLGEFSGTAMPSNDTNNVLSVEIIRSILNKEVTNMKDVKKEVPMEGEEEVRAETPAFIEEQKKKAEEEAAAAKMADKKRSVDEIFAEEAAKVETARTIEVAPATDNEVIRALTVTLEEMARQMAVLTEEVRSVADNQLQLTGNVARTLVSLPKQVAAEMQAMPRSEATALQRIADVATQAQSYTASKSGLRSPRGE